MAAELWRVQGDATGGEDDSGEAAWCGENGVETQMNTDGHG
jgi:hypothetical protein